MASRVRRVAGHLIASNTAAGPRCEPFGPLSGTRVLDLTLVVSGPCPTSVLADQGADVIKIEGAATPDLARRLGATPTPEQQHGLSATYGPANRGIRSLVLDFAVPDGVAVLKSLAAHSDVVVQNFRQGVAARLGISYDDLKIINDDLVYLTISEYGATGPYASAKVYDQAIQAQAGVSGIMKAQDGAPSMFYNLLMDKVTALNAVQSVTAALLAKARGYGGQHIELSMVDNRAHFSMPDAGHNHVWAKHVPKALDWAAQHSKSEFACSDGKVALTLEDFSQFQALLLILALHAEHFMEVEWKVPRDWLRVRDKAIGRIREEVSKIGRREFFQLCLQNSLPCECFLLGDEVLEDPQVIHNGTFQTRAHPVGGEYRTARPLPQFIKTPWQVQGPSPFRGQYSNELLAEFGFSTEEVAALKRDGVVG